MHEVGGFITRLSMRVVTIAATLLGAWVAFLLWYTMIAECGSPEALVLGPLSLALAGLVIGILVMRRSRPLFRSVGVGVLIGSVLSGILVLTLYLEQPIGRSECSGFAIATSSLSVPVPVGARR